MGSRLSSSGGGSATTDASQLTTGTVPLGRLSGITHAQLDAAAGILAAQIASVNPSTLTGSGTVPASALPAATTSAQGAVQLGTQTPVPASRAGAAGSSTSAAPADHAHLAAPGLWMPADMGWLAWNTDPWLANNNAAASAGVLWLFKVLLPAQISVTNVLVRIQTLGSSLATCFAGVYNSAGTLVGSSADQSAAWASTGVKTMALSGGPYTCGPGFVWVGLLMGAGSALRYQALPNAGDNTMTNGALATTALRGATYSSGLSALPTPLTLASLVANSAQTWVALS